MSTQTRAPKPVDWVAVVDLRRFSRAKCFWRARTKWRCGDRGRYAVENRVTGEILNSCNSHIGAAVEVYCGQ